MEDEPARSHDRQSDRFRASPSQWNGHECYAEHLPRPLLWVEGELCSLLLLSRFTFIHACIGRLQQLREYYADQHGTPG